VLCSESVSDWQTPIALGSGMYSKLSNYIGDASDTATHTNLNFCVCLHFTPLRLQPHRRPASGAGSGERQ
jgi:hypothetical protein